MARIFPKKQVTAHSVTSDDLEIDSGTLSIDADNNRVGVGTISPNGKLEVVSGNDGNGTIAVRSGNAAQYSKISIGTNANKATLGVSGAVDTFFTGVAQDDLVIRADDNNNKVHIGAGTSGPAQLVVTEHAGAAPRVGIGTSDPGTSLQIEDGAPYLTLKNNTSENTAGGCESKIIFEDHANAALGEFEVSHSGSSDDTKGQVIVSVNNGSGLQTALTIADTKIASFTGSVTSDGSAYLKEKANADPDFTAYGQLWVKTATPNQLYFTTDAGNDIQITSGTEMASSGGAAVDDVNLHLHIAVFS